MLPLHPFLRALKSQWSTIYERKFHLHPCHLERSRALGFLALQATKGRAAAWLVQEFSPCALLATIAGEPATFLCIFIRNETLKKLFIWDRNHSDLFLGQRWCCSWYCSPPRRQGRRTSPPPMATTTNSATCPTTPPTWTIWHNSQIISVLLQLYRNRLQEDFFAHNLLAFCWLYYN